jgi:hypothetical protein
MLHRLCLHLRRFLAASIVLFVCSYIYSVPASAQLAAGVLDGTRSVQWQNSAGIPNYSANGTLPSDSWTQCGPTIAAYGSSSAYATPGTIVNALNHTGAGYQGCGPNTYVLLGAGKFYLNGGISVTGANQDELRGSGPTLTKLYFSNGSTCVGGAASCLVSFQSADSTYGGGVSNGYSWTGGYAQGANTITLSSGANIVANSTIVVLNQCDTGYSGSPCNGSARDNGNLFNCSDAYNPGNGTGCSFNASNAGLAPPHRFQTEMVEVTACTPACGSSGTTTLTITPGLEHPNWSSSQTPQAYLIQPSRYVGLRDLSIDGTATTLANATHGTAFFNAAYYWQRNVVITNAARTGTYLWQVIHGDVSSNYIYDPGQNNVQNDPAGINFTGSNNLIANNIIQDAHTCIFGNGPAAGNVIAYNFNLNTYTGDSFLFGCIWDGHSNGADYNLFEGNVAPQALQDQTHGTHLMETWYRNFFTGWESCANGNCGSNAAKNNDVIAFAALSYNRYDNLVANVLGTPGVTTLGYQSSGSGYVTGGVNGYAYIIGSGNNNAPPEVAGGPIPLDPLVGSTMLRWGNWDAFNGTTEWNAAEVPSGISLYPNPAVTACTSASCPKSFYFGSRPGWWSSAIPFPAIGPDVAGGNVGQCSGKLNTPGQYAGLPAVASSQCAGSALSPAWGGHVNAIPAMACYLNTMAGPPDGTGAALAFDANVCYGGAPAAPQAPGTPQSLQGTAK